MPESSVSSHCLNFRKRLKTRHVDAFWVSHAPDLFYLAGYSSEGLWGLIGRRQQVLLAPPLVAEQAAALAPGFKVETVKKSSEIHARMVDLAAKYRWSSIGYDPYHAAEAHIHALRKASGHRLKWVAIPSATTPLRIKKDLEEVKALRLAGRLVFQGFEHIRQIAKPGMRECDLAGEFEAYIRKNGASKASFDSIVASGENAAYPHYITGNRFLLKNDIVLCDLGALVDGYCSDLTRTFFLGRISPLGQKIYDIVAQAQRLAIEAVKPGVKTAQIDRIARDEIERAGYGRRFIHSTGHGVGIEVHEAPGVGPASTEVLEPGMVITVEPGIYLQGFGGVRIEDTLLVTQDGHEILTRLS